MKLIHRLLQHVGRLAAALMLGAAVLPLAAAEADDPPGRVGRLADLTGQVWMFAPESGEWVAATRNQPLTAGDRLSTDADGRAVVRIGSTTLRLDSGSELELLRLDDERMSVQLHNGSLSTRLRSREAANEFDLKTAEGQFTVQRAGRYRFDRLDATSEVTVYNGQALYEGPGSALTVNSGQRAEFWIDASDAAQYSITEPRRDAFAAWNSERDRGDDRSVSTRYVSPEMTGVEDLDRYGRWDQSPEYGALWVPRGVASGWAPYSTGRWAWVRPWGWTWVDDAPWGFAPFHYGRWVWYRSAWCWSPGTYVARPVYAPALVAWVGGANAGVSLSIGGGFSGPAVGWFPLGPREVYVPSYRHSPRYVRQVNVTQVTNVTQITNVINAPGVQRDFSNRKFPLAVTVVPTSVMTGRQPVGPVSSQLRDVPGVRELVREPGRHAAVQAPPVSGPVVSPSAGVRTDDRRVRPTPVAPLSPGSPAAPVDAARPDGPAVRAGGPGPRRGDFDRPGTPAQGTSVPVRPGVGNGGPGTAPIVTPATGDAAAGRRPTQEVPPLRPPAAAGVGIGGPQGVSRPVAPPNTTVGEPPARGVAPPSRSVAPPAPAVAPPVAPTVRSVPRPAPEAVDRRPAYGPAPAAPVAAPTQPRPMPQAPQAAPERRRAEPLPSAGGPVQGPAVVRSERAPREDNGERRAPQRERGQPN